MEGLHKAIRSLISIQLFSRLKLSSLRSSTDHVAKIVHILVTLLYKQCITWTVFLNPEILHSWLIFSTVSSIQCYHNVLEPGCMDNKIHRVLV